MEDDSSNGCLVQKIINQLSDRKHIHICIHFLSGKFYGNKALEINRENAIHCNPFCNAAKTTSKGLRCCLRNKSFSIKKALNMAHTYTGKCYLGATEVVTPVFHNGQPLCIIYVGNLLVVEEKDDIRRRIKKMCRVTGVSEGLLLDSLGMLEAVKKNNLRFYMDSADILSSVIKLCIVNSSIGTKNTSRQENCEAIHWIIRQVINYVENYYSADIGLHRIANLYNMNHQYLCRLFKKETGMNFSNYLNRIRLKNAKKQLAATDRSITEIALSVGFNSSSYFDTVFKKHLSLTPCQYRKETRRGS